MRDAVDWIDYTDGKVLKQEGKGRGEIGVK
jgi:hypothetical protein